MFQLSTTWTNVAANCRERNRNAQPARRGQEEYYKKGLRNSKDEVTLRISEEAVLNVKVITKNDKVCEIRENDGSSMIMTNIKYGCWIRGVQAIWLSMKQCVKIL